MLYLSFDFYLGSSSVKKEIHVSAFADKILSNMFHEWLTLFVDSVLSHEK